MSESPPLRDTVVVPHGGYIVIRSLHPCFFCNPRLQVPRDDRRLVHGRKYALVRTAVGSRLRFPNWDSRSSAATAARLPEGLRHVRGASGLFEEKE